MTAVDVDALDKLREAAALGSLRVGEHYGIHLYAGENPVGTTLRAADAALIVAAVNALPDLLAEVRRGRALREAVEGLAEEYDVGRLWSSQLADRLSAALAAVDES